MPFSPIRLNPVNTKQTAYTSSLKQFVYQTFEIVHVTTHTVLDRYTLVINPTDLQMPEKARTAMTNTLGGAFVDKFGRAIPQVTIQGTMGWRQRMSWEGSLTDGYLAFKRLRNDIYRRFLDSTDPNLELRWYNWEDEEHYVIMPMPDGFSLQRSNQEPLLYRYNFSFWCLSPIIQQVQPHPVNVYTLGSSILNNLGSLSQSMRASAAISGVL